MVKHYYCQPALIRESESVRKLWIHCHPTDVPPGYRLHYFDVTHHRVFNILECAIRQWPLSDEFLQHHRRRNAGRVTEWCLPLSTSEADHQPINARRGNNATDTRDSLLRPPWHTTSVSVFRRHRTRSFVNAMSTTCRKKIPAEFLHYLEPHSPYFYDSDTRVDKSSNHVMHKQLSSIYRVS